MTRQAAGREGANMPEGNFDNEEIYPLPPSSPLVSNSPQYLMSSCLKDTRRGNVLDNNLDAAISGLYIPHALMCPSLETFEK